MTSTAAAAGAGAGTLDKLIKITIALDGDDRGGERDPELELLD